MTRIDRYLAISAIALAFQMTRCCGNLVCGLVFLSVTMEFPARTLFIPRRAPPEHHSNSLHFAVSRTRSSHDATYATINTLFRWMHLESVLPFLFRIFRIFVVRPRRLNRIHSRINANHNRRQIRRAPARRIADQLPVTRRSGV